jgi:hypothetical protein
MMTIDKTCTVMATMTRTPRRRSSCLVNPWVASHRRHRWRYRSLWEIASRCFSIASKIGEVVAAKTM